MKCLSLIPGGKQKYDRLEPEYSNRLKRVESACLSFSWLYCDVGRHVAWCRVAWYKVLVWESPGVPCFPALNTICISWEKLKILWLAHLACRSHRYKINSSCGQKNEFLTLKNAPPLMIAHVPYKNGQFDTFIPLSPKEIACLSFLLWTEPS